MTPEVALSHLFFHCCFKDNVVTENEIKAVSEKLVAVGLNKELNFKDEVVQYRNYRNSIKDESAYIENLISSLRPTNSLALYAACLELCLSDELLQLEEEKLLQRLATALDLEDEEQTICKKLMIQRKIVETGNVY